MAHNNRGILTTGILIAITVGIAILGIGGGAVWYIKYQSAKKAEEEAKKLQTRVITPAELPPSALAPQAPIIFLTASPDMIKYDGTDKAVLLKAAIGGNPTSCSYDWDKNISGTKSKEYKITIPGTIQAHQIYTIACESEGGSVSKSATVTISAAEPPAITLAADKEQVNYKGSAVLSWSSRNAANCTLKDTAGKSLSQNLEGVKTLSLLTKSSAYILTCSGPGGWGSKFVSIIVNAPISTTGGGTTGGIGGTGGGTTGGAKTPTLSLSASASTIAYNSPVTLSWSSKNISSCNASSTPYGAWVGPQSVSGTNEIQNLTESKTFSLNCQGNYGAVSQSVSVAVSAAPVPEISFSAEPSTVSYNGSSSLKWSATNTKSCTASGAWSGPKSISGAEDIKNLIFNKTFTLTCDGEGGSVSKSVPVTVGAAPGPTITLSAEPTAVSYNGSSKLTWSAIDARSCSASGGWSGSKAMSGAEEIKGLTYNKTYTLTCSGIGGSSSKSVLISVGTAPAPVISLSANPEPVPYNSPTTITWSATDARSCSASGGWSGSKAISGTEETDNLTESKTFSISCSGPGGGANKSITVKISYTYAWAEENSWSACSATCGGGTQTAKPVCKKSNGQTMPDDQCSQPKPTEISQSCNTQECLLYGNVRKTSDCTKAGGAVNDDGSGNKFCRFGGNFCPSSWTQYGSWSETSSNKCTGTNIEGQCLQRAICETGGHSFANTPAEICTYENHTWLLTEMCTKVECKKIGFIKICNPIVYPCNRCELGDSKNCYANITSVGCY